MKLPLNALHHVAREVADVARATAFYRDLLGFHAIWRPELAFDGAWLLGYGIQIHIIEGNPGERTDKISTRGDHIAFHTENMDEVERTLTEQEIPFRLNIQAKTGVKQIFFHDPDGNTIEIGTYPPVREIGA